MNVDFGSSKADNPRLLMHVLYRLGVVAAFVNAFVAAPLSHAHRDHDTWRGHAGAASHHRRAVVHAHFDPHDSPAGHPAGVRLHDRQPSETLVVVGFLGEAASWAPPVLTTEPAPTPGVPARVWPAPAPRERRAHGPPPCPLRPLRAPPA